MDAIIKIPTNMTQEKKDLLLKDLCARLPYEVALKQTYKVTVIATNTEEVLTRTIYLYSINSLDDMTVSGIHNDGDQEICFLEEIKPYLFPLSSMTEEQKNECFKGTPLEIDKYGDIAAKDNFYGDSQYTNLENYLQVINWLLKNHFDIYGLIPFGLAEDATGLNIY